MKKRIMSIILIIALIMGNNVSVLASETVSDEQTVLEESSSETADGYELSVEDKLVEGDSFNLGYYPQTMVTDETLIEELESCDGDWYSYEYYDSTGVKADYMKYKDVLYNGNKYRAVVFSEYRPYAGQSANGFAIDTVYWFMYEPIKWNLIDAETGLAVCEQVIDSQAYHHTSATVNGYYGNNYEKSDVREWLINTFFDTAFTNEQEEFIKLTMVDNSATSSEYSSTSTNDKIFLLSKGQVDSLESSERTVYGTDYAKIQGIRVNEDGYVKYWLTRTAADASFSIYYVHKRSSGYIAYNNWEDDTITGNSMGMRPAIYLDLEAWENGTSNENVFVIENGVLTAYKGFATKAQIPSSVKYIGDRAFYGCSRLVSVEIPDGVVSIGKFAFAGCTSLTSIEIPDSVTDIEGAAFEGCSSLASVELSDNITAINPSTFFRCRGLTNIKIPEGVTSIGTQAFYDCSNLINIDMPDSLISIGSQAFVYCGMESVIIPEKVSSIGESAFACCDNLESIVIPYSVESIGNAAFYNSDNLSTIKILNPDCEIYDHAGTIEDSATIYGYEGSTAESYARKYSRTFSKIDGDDVEYWAFVHNLPKLSEDSARQFLAFVYCNSDYEDIDLSQNDIFNLLIGNYQQFDSILEVKFIIWDFSLFVRGAMNKQIAESSYAVDYLLDDLVVFWYEQYEQMDEIDVEIVNDVTGKCVAIIKDGLEGLMASELAENFDLVLTEDTFDTSKLMISTYEQFEDLPGKIQDYANKLVAATETVMLPFETEIKGRSTYFNCYLSNRKDYDTAEDEIFQTIMDYNFLVISDSTYFSNIINFTTWITGKENWSKHVDEIECWAETLYQLEQSISYDKEVGDGEAENVIHTVTFNSNGGTNLSITTKEVGENKTIDTLPTVQRDGYAFKGWYTATTGGTKVTENTVITADTTFYAQWEKIIVSIEKATVTLSASSYVYDGTEKKPNITVTLNGKNLKEGTDYTVSYINNVAVGTATITITGKDSYTGSISKTYTIGASSINGATVILSATSYTYDGTAKQPIITVKLGNKTLTSGTDYTVSYKNNTAVGTATVTVIGKGNYGGTIDKTYTISSASLKDAKITLSTTSYNYNGKSKKPKVTVRLSNILLTEENDYTVTYKNNIAAGTATVVITGTGNYKGTKTTTFTIHKAEITVKADNVSKVYGQTDTAFTWKITQGKLADGESLKGITAKRELGENVGSYAIILSQSNGSNTNYDITFESGTLKITQKEIGITWSNSEFVYNGKTQTPTATATGVLNNDVCTLTVTGGQTNVGEGYTAKVTGISNSNYKLPQNGLTKEYSIIATSISKAAVSLSKTSYNYDGKSKKPSVTVTLGDKKLVKDTDYTVSYKNNKNIGTATVTIKGKGNYAGTVSKTFTIKVKKGTTFTSGKYKYNVTGTSTVAFNGIKSTKTTKVTIPKTVEYGGKTFKVTSITDKALKGKTKVTQVTIGENVTKIGASAFAGCTKLSKVTIGKKVKTIGVSAFEGCKKLTKVTIGSAVTKIGDKAFKKCTALKSITIPSKVTTIGKQAFYGCKELKTITIKTTKMKTVGSKALKGINSKATIKVPKKKLKAYTNLLNGKGQGKKVKIVKY